MEILLNVLKIIGDYIIPGIAAIGLLAAVPFVIVFRKNYLSMIKDKIAQKEYVRLILIFIIILFSLTGAVNLVAFRFGLTEDRFWFIKDFLGILIFVFGTVEVIIRKKRITGDVKGIINNYGHSILFWFAAVYLLGAISIGSYLFGY